MPHRGITSFVYLVLLICAVITSASATEDSIFIKFETENLINGQKLWLENCKGCHAYGTAGAPVPMLSGEWEHRVIKDRAVLYDHAINGFFGADDTMMPERGGNENLTDKQVKLAVDYMVSLAKHYLNKQSQ